MIQKKHKGERLLEIDNVHVADCGPPPVVDATGKYVGYFQNEYGEQWVFIGDRKTGEAVIYGGDVGWQSQYKASGSKPFPGDLILSREEKEWIIACFVAMCNASYDAVASAFAKGEFLASALGMMAALCDPPAVEPANRGAKNGTNGIHRKDGRPEE